MKRRSGVCLSRCRTSKPPCRAPKLRSIPGAIAALVAGGLSIALEMWTIVPAPNLSTLALGVAIPELGPWTAACCLIAGAIAAFAGSGWARNVGLGCAALALGLALVPWCLLPATIANCDLEMGSALGEAVAGGRAPGPLRMGSPQRPYDVGIALAGYGPTAPLRERRDLAVRTRDGQRLGLDVYAPSGGGAHAAVVVIYGGAWIFGSRAASAELARSLAGLGYTAIAIDYRHAPAYHFPTQIDDVRDALSAIARHAGAWNVDPRRVAILGRSAGAELALLAAYAPEPLAIRAAIGYYAPTDLVEGYRVPPQPDPAGVQRILLAYLGGPPFGANLTAYVAGSPVAHVRRGLPPTLLINGRRDELVRPAFAYELRDALRRHGNRAAALMLPWSNHAFDTVPNGTGGQLARYYTARFLAATL